MKGLLRLAPIVLLMFVVVGCASTGGSRSGEDGGVAGERGGADVEDLSRDQPLPGERPISSEGPRIPVPELKTIYFDYDKAILRDDQLAAMDQNAAWLRANPDKVIEVEGHCDNRGSEQYNMGLGERRALRVREYMIEKGVAADHLFTKSYGELRPVVPQATTNDEYQQNRRVEFKEIPQ